MTKNDCIGNSHNVAKVTVTCHVYTEYDIII